MQQVWTENRGGGRVCRGAGGCPWPASRWLEEDCRRLEARSLEGAVRLRWPWRPSQIGGFPGAMDGQGAHKRPFFPIRPFRRPDCPVSLPRSLSRSDCTRSAAASVSASLTRTDMSSTAPSTASSGRAQVGQKIWMHSSGRTRRTAISPSIRSNVARNFNLHTSRGCDLWIAGLARPVAGIQGLFPVENDHLSGWGDPLCIWARLRVEHLAATRSAKVVTWFFDIDGPRSSV